MEEVKSYRNKGLSDISESSVSLPKLRNDSIAKLENALMFMSYLNSDTHYSEAKTQVSSMRVFDGSWLVDTSFKHSDGDFFALRPYTDDQVSPDMFPDLNIKTLNLFGEVATINKHRFLNAKEKRGLDKFRYILKQDTGFLDYGNQKWWTDSNGFGVGGLNKKIDKHKVFNFIPTSLKKGYVIPSHALKKYFQDDDNLDVLVHRINEFHMALQLQLTYYYEWSCYIRENENSIGIRIPIHPSSSKEVFVMRNIPDGKTRKKAIVNYVKDHYRTIKNEEGGEHRKVLIKKHFRGDLKFNWRGLEVHITPSRYDLNRVKTKKEFNLKNI